MEQSIKNVLHNPGSPVYGVGGANLHAAPPTCMGVTGALAVVGIGAAIPGRASRPKRSCIWEERWLSWLPWLFETPPSERDAPPGCAGFLIAVLPLLGPSLARVYCQVGQKEDSDADRQR